MSNPNEECRKGKKDAEFKFGQEVYTIEISEKLDSFHFKKWVVVGKNPLNNYHYLFKNNSPGFPIVTTLCPDSIFITPQEAAEELHSCFAMMNRSIEKAANLGPEGIWDIYIV